MSANIDSVQHVVPIETPRAIDRNLPHKRDKKSPYRSDVVELHNEDQNEEEPPPAENDSTEVGHIDVRV
jgi:hypothetical protein